MGHELQAKVVPPIEPALLQKAIKEAFASLNWTIVRPQEHVFSVAVAGRINNSWDEDFVIGVGNGLDRSTGRVLFDAKPVSSAETAGTFIYLCHHGGPGEQLAEIQGVVDGVVRQAGAHSFWDDL